MKNWYTKSLHDLSEVWDTKQGLTQEQIIESLEVHGKNELLEVKGKTWLVRFIDQFKDVTIIILLIASVFSFFAKEHVDAIIIFAIVFLNAIIGLIQEGKAERALAALKKMSTPHATVIRDHQEVQILSTDIVVADLVVLSAGDVVPADIRLIETQSLQIQEASLTGESLPVDKDASLVLEKDTVLGDRLNMAYSSGMVTYGRGKGLVVAVGMETEVGNIAKLLNEAVVELTPLQVQLNDLGKKLGAAALLACTIILVVGLINQQGFLEMLMTSVSLAVAVVPESLPAVATIVLAMGVQRLVKQNAIVRNLPSVETLGSASVICSDKTGTLTQNVMSVVESWSYDHVDTLVEGLVLCNDASFVNGKWIGDPTETALTAWGKTFEKDIHHMIKSYERNYEIPFDSGRKRMSTQHHVDDQYVVYAKGGVDEILAISTHLQLENEVVLLTDEGRNTILKMNEKMGKKALRVLALATKVNKEDDKDLESNLTFVGLVGMIDPPRPEVKEAIKLAKQAGIRVVMITGDHAITAQAIGLEIGLIEDGGAVISGSELDKMSDQDLFEKVMTIGVYARVSPEHKMRIIDAWKKHGHIVAMTGDGVNDAPALKRADIGAAMGIVGTEVAKGAADMVLMDDNFATVVVAIEEGRRIKDNILKAISYLLSCNVGELLLLLVAIFMNWGAPLLPIHLLWINLVTDSLPALALGVDGKEDDIMDRNPDMSRTLLGKPMLWRFSYQGFVIALVALFAYMYGAGVGVFSHLNNNHELGMTMAFTVLGFSQLIHSFSIHSPVKSAFTSFWKNKWLLLAVFVNSAMILSVLFVGSLREIFKLEVMDTRHWFMTLILMVIPFIVVELMKVFKLNGKHR